MSKPKTRESDKPTNKTPSQFGSHAVMVSQEWTEKLTDPNWVVLEGESGFYVTTRWSLDSGMADPYRYAVVEYRVNKLKELLSGVEVTHQEDKISLKLS